MTGTTLHDLARLEAQIYNRVAGRVYDIRLVLGENGLILRGQARTYHARTLVHQAVCEATDLPIIANEITVC